MAMKLKEFKKKYLRATWTSIKQGTGDASMPQAYLVFMVPTDEWQLMEYEDPFKESASNEEKHEKG